MIKIKCDNWDPDKILDVVNQMRNLGYKQGHDFDFEYHPPTYSQSYAWDGDTEKYGVFRFYNEKLATWFELRYR